MRSLLFAVGRWWFMLVVRRCVLSLAVTVVASCCVLFVVRHCLVAVGCALFVVRCLLFVVGLCLRVGVLLRC